MGKPKSRYVEAEVARELLNHKPVLHAGIADFLSECGVNHAFCKSRDELALDVLDALLEYAKIQLPEAPAATLVFNGTSNTIGAAFDETEPASTSDLSERGGGGGVPWVASESAARPCALGWAGDAERAGRVRGGDGMRAA
jgi:hypothetical protein